MKNKITTQDLGELGLSVSNSISAMLAYWDKNLICRFANNAYRDWVGKSKEEMIDKINMKDLWGPVFEKNLTYIKGALSGEKQEFDGEIVLPDGTSRYSLTTYYPDIEKNEVLGFFVHSADVTYIKKLEIQLAKMKREMLKNVIETEEKEKASIAEILRDDISPTLAFCKMMLEIKVKENEDGDFFNEVTVQLKKCIKELRVLSRNLMPDELELLGLIPALKDHLDSFSEKYNNEIQLEYDNEDIEKLDLSYKLSIFRIVECFLVMERNNRKSKNIRISINYDKTIKLKLIDDNIKGSFKKKSKEYKSIQNRVEYYGGTMDEVQTETENILNVELKID